MVYIDDDLEQFDLEEALTLLPLQRYEQVMRFRSERDRRLSVAVYRLLCRGLREEYGIEEPPTFEYGAHGKPSLVGHPDIHFNMSHCRQAAICVLAPHPVGVDVERFRRYDERLVSFTMNEEECVKIRQSERPDVEFIKWWTRKEALLKCRGTGISHEMRDVLTDVRGVQFTTVVVDRRQYVYTICRQDTGR